MLVMSSHNKHWCSELEIGVIHHESNCLVTSEAKKQKPDERQSLLEEWLTNRFHFCAGERASGCSLNQKALPK